MRSHCSPSPVPDIETLAALRSSSNRTFNTDITSVAAITAAFMRFLGTTRGDSTAKFRKVVNVSGGTGSIALSLHGPRTAITE
ncbi:hypothetical protein NHQ30_002172 [Ciborinia camelliae]|nr:hypothetical protein NHQ30_002172 [Ciborinia camelliae]